MKPKHMIFSGLFLIVLMFAGADSVLAQRGANKVKNASWQTSVNDSERGRVVLGIRDKWGDLGSFTATFVVRSANGKIFRGRVTTTGDEWAYIDFPGNFSGSPRAAGTYTVVFYANGIIIGRDRFRFRP